MSGIFITLEGVEGAGKTTLARRLEDWLRKREFDFIIAREPGGTEAGEAIRHVLLSAAVPLCPEAELLLMQAARAQIMHEVIQPALDAGKVVILDRHRDSSVAYQGYGRGLDIRQIEAMNDFSCNNRKPDLTLLLDIEAQAGMHRSLKSRTSPEGPDRFELESLVFMERVRQGFLKMARNEPDRFVVLSAQEDLERVWQETREVVERVLAGRR